MKALVVGVAALGFLAVSNAAEAREVRVTLTGVEARGGEVLASLQTEAQFMRGPGAYNAVLTPPNGGGALEIVFNDVAPGEYAFAAMHDENSDRTMQMQANGMPAEGYAMSNAGALTGPPTFVVVKFTVGADSVVLTEPMYYPYVPPAR